MATIEDKEGQRLGGLDVDQLFNKIQFAGSYLLEHFRSIHS